MRMLVGAPTGAPVASGGMSGQGTGRTTVQANPTRERNTGVKGIPVFVSWCSAAETSGQLIERSVWYAIARLTTSVSSYCFSLEGGDAHVESEPARIGCLLPCWYVRQE